MNMNILIEIGLRLALMIVVVFLVPFIKNYIEAHKEEKETKTALMLADMVVKAIEQTCGIENADKKALATSRLKDFLKSKKITLSDKMIDDLIEAAVNILPHSK